MQITKLGHASFKIQTKNSNGEITVVTDPFDNKVGFKMPKTTANIITVSHNHHNHSQTQEVQGEPFIAKGPGEYEIKGVFIYGIPSFHDKQKGAEKGNNTIYTIKLIEEDISIAHLGDLGHVLTNNQLSHLENIDILLIPVGGKYTIDYKEAVQVINQIEPRIIIPMHYKTPNSKVDDISTAEDFCKEIGLPCETMDRLKISKKDLPQEDMQVILLDN